MDMDITIVALVVGFVAGWIIRMIIARNRTLSDAVPAAGLAILQELAAALADGKITADELGRIANALITTITSAKDIEKK